MGLVHIRPAVIADAEALAELHVASWQAAYRGLLPQAYLDELDAGSRISSWRSLLGELDPPGKDVLVCSDAAGLTGFVFVGAARDQAFRGERMGEVFSLYAHPDGWGTGAGRALMAAGLDALACGGFVDACLWVPEANSRARRFYTAGGWFADGARQDLVIGGSTVVEMRYRRAVN